MCFGDSCHRPASFLQFYTSNPTSGKLIEELCVCFSLHPRSKVFFFIFLFFLVRRYDMFHPHSRHQKKEESKEYSGNTSCFCSGNCVLDPQRSTLVSSRLVSRREMIKRSEHTILSAEECERSILRRANHHQCAVGWWGGLCFLVDVH